MKHTVMTKTSETTVLSKTPPSRIVLMGTVLYGPSGVHLRDTNISVLCLWYISLIQLKIYKTPILIVGSIDND